MEISEFQNLMKDLYFKNDRKRGIHRTALWLGEELGELFREIKFSKNKMDREVIANEMTDIIAWTASLANLLEIDLQSAVIKKYPYKCSKCNSNPCRCKKNLS